RTPQKTEPLQGGGSRVIVRPFGGDFRYRFTTEVRGRLFSPTRNQAYEVRGGIVDGCLCWSRVSCSPSTSWFQSLHAASRDVSGVEPRPKTSRPASQTLVSYAHGHNLPFSNKVR